MRGNDLLHIHHAEVGIAERRVEDDVFHGDGGAAVRLERVAAQSDAGKWETGGEAVGKPAAVFSLAVLLLHRHAHQHVLVHRHGLDVRHGIIAEMHPQRAPQRLESHGTLGSKGDLHQRVALLRQCVFDVEVVAAGGASGQRTDILHLKHLQIVAGIQVLELDARKNKVEDRGLNAGSARGHHLLVMAIRTFIEHLADALAQKKQLAFQLLQTIAQIGRINGHFVIGGILESVGAERAITVTILGHRVHQHIGGIDTTMHGHPLKIVTRLRILLGEDW